MPEPLEPYYAAANKVGAMGHELEHSCPKAAVVLLALAESMKIADIDSESIDLMANISALFAEWTMEICKRHRQKLREMAESN